MRPLVTMETSKGNVTIEVFSDKMPITSSNFLDLIDNGYYNGLHFHRVIKGFMIQGGCSISRDPSSPRCGTGGPGYTIQDEHPDDARFSNDVGTLSMANTGRPNSGGAQFFINTNHNSFLDWWDMSTPSKHPVFAKVTDGMDIIRDIENSPTGMGDKPVEPIQIISIKRC
ncbi:MAG: peptidylprolyl isomerase [Thermoplasmata archaeon]|nr:peptidylprolyl isomerase [Thermoplasmata archaeon]